jgi:LmbE family N-acetylglucosaminyl deacetylase
MEERDRLQPIAETWQRALAVVAHPDDLEYGSANAIAKWTSQGKDVTYLLLTRGEAGIDSMTPEEASPLREAEERASAKVVGVDVVEFLDHRDGVIEYGLPLRRDIAREIRKRKPDVLITGNYHLQWNRGNLNMADHRWAGLAVLDAARDAGNRWIFPELLDEGLEPWGGVGMVLVGGSPNPTHGVDVSDFIEMGIKSLQEHKVYIENLSQKVDPDEMLRWNASIIGERLGCEYAVGFEVVRI